jgi:hypothetical protein
VLIAIAAIGLQACVAGKVLDPRDDTGLAATVKTFALCTGSSCTVQGLGWQNTVATPGPEQGGFAYNAYPANAPSAHLAVAAGSEAFEMQFSLGGFQTRTVFHHPNYVQVTTDDAGAPVYATVLPRPVYLCPTNAIDSDGDTVCDVAEAKYQTNPQNEDTDGDGLSDDFELFGSGGLDLAFYGANPRHRDIFVELDYYKGTAQGITIDFTFRQEGIDELVAAFAAAPLMNPDAVSGISLHVLVDTAIDPAVEDSDLHLHFPNSLLPPFNDWSAFEPIKAKYMNPIRARAFHYGVIAYGASQSLGPIGGLSRGMPAHDFVLTSGNYSNDMHFQAVGIMHELGHNLGLSHGGPIVEALADSKPNYLSVMNYLYSGAGLRRDGVDTLDYSRHPLAAVAENSLSEPNGFAQAPGSTTTETDLARYGLHYCLESDTLPGFPVLVCRNMSGVLHRPDGSDADASGNIDFNDNDELDFGTVSADLDGDGATTNTYPASQNDWMVLQYCGNAVGGGVIAATGQDPVCPLGEAPGTSQAVPCPVRQP